MSKYILQEGKMIKIEEKVRTFEALDSFDLLEKFIKENSERFQSDIIEIKECLDKLKKIFKKLELF